MRSAYVTILFLLLAPPAVLSQRALTVEDLSLAVTRTLLTKSLPSYAEELAKEKPNLVKENLVCIEVFARTGQDDELRDSLLRLARAADLPPVESRGWILQIVRRKISKDLDALRFYYTNLTRDDGYYETNPFVELWQSQGDEKELDAWLLERSIPGSSWFTVNLERNLRRRSAQPILDRLAAVVREKPGDTKALRDYLNAVQKAQEFSRGLNHWVKTNSRWSESDLYPLFADEANVLGEVYSFTTARQNYDFGQSVHAVSPVLAIKYYLASLTAPVTEDELKSLRQNHAIVSVPVNWEKQLRFWTKEKLAAAYKQTGQPQLAQPLMEELVSLKGDDILGADLMKLAGAVQSGSGVRQIESKVLREEATRSNSLEYWYERIQYYKGRRELGGMINSFREALPRISTQDRARFTEYFGDSFAYLFRESSERSRYAGEVGEMMRAQYRSVPLESETAFAVIRLSLSDRLDLRDLSREIFVDQTISLSLLLKNRNRFTWGLHEMLSKIIKDERLLPARQKEYFRDLEKIAVRGDHDRKRMIADLLKDAGEPAAAVRIIREHLATPLERTEDKGDRTNARQFLFDCYIAEGDWRSAEKLLENHQIDFLQHWGNRLERLAIVAGQNKAPDDAFRIWLKAVNFVGHSTFGLINLAETPAKTKLRDYYQGLLATDPDSKPVKAALQMLR